MANNQTSRPHHRKTKIIATLGPSSNTPEVIRKLINAGVNVFRFNFSHGSHADHLEVLNRVRGIADELNMPVAVLQDLGGPKIRISRVKENFTPIEDGAMVELCHGQESDESSNTLVYVQGLDPAKFLKPGNRVLFADGIIEFRTEAVQGQKVLCKATKGGRLRSRVGVAFPDSSIDLPATTEKDIKDLVWGLEHGVDYVAVSFVKNAEDLRRTRRVVEQHKGDVRIISKIELKTALENIYEILQLSDGIMIARGDLGLELPIEKLPLIQKELIAQSNYLGLPVIVATQMLHSMVSSLRPTRAEVSDVATAVMGGADAVMLSEETAIGNHPVESVVYLDKIAREAEQSFTYEEYRLRLRDADKETIPDAVAYAACAAAIKVDASAIIVCTETGNSARLVAKYRPQQPLFGAGMTPRTLRRMSLYWGVQPISCTSSSTHVEEIEAAIKEIRALEHLSTGSRVIITGGLAVRTPGATSVLEIKVLT